LIFSCNLVYYNIYRLFQLHLVDKTTSNTRTPQQGRDEKGSNTLTTYHQERRPVRRIPTREQLEEAARRQALVEQEQENDYDLEEGEE
jgi:hypothetical protein